MAISYHQQLANKGFLSLGRSLIAYSNTAYSNNADHPTTGCRKGLINRFKKRLMFRKLLLLLSSLLLVSCAGNTDDLETWVANIKAKPPGRIEPMPDVKVYQPYDYASSQLRSPFSAMQPELEAQLKLLHDGCDESIQPDPNRRREELERFSLDSMEMVGTIDRAGTGWGLIRMTAGPNTGQVIKVVTGEYLGIHHGQIDNITNQRIKISTLVPDNKGCWEKRTVYLTLVEG